MDSRVASLDEGLGGRIDGVPVVGDYSENFLERYDCKRGGGEESRVCRKKGKSDGFGMRKITNLVFVCRFSRHFCREMVNTDGLSSQVKHFDPHEG